MAHTDNEHYTCAVECQLVRQCWSWLFQEGGPAFVYMRPRGSVRLPFPVALISLSPMDMLTSGHLVMLSTLLDDWFPCSDETRCMLFVSRGRPEVLEGVRLTIGAVPIHHALLV